MKNLTLIYCGEDGDAGKALADDLRRKDTDNKVILCSCEYFSGPDGDAQKVIIMPDVPEWRAQTIREAYPGNVLSAPLIIGVNSYIGADEMLSYMAPVPGEKITITPPKKRGWPKGKPRKAVA